MLDLHIAWDVVARLRVELDPGDVDIAELPLGIKELSHASLAERSSFEVYCEIGPAILANARIKSQ
ncbi:MAG: hypothetical protein N838_14030 [Thiohalocapsa sp. PB-PSB1]|nr:MAG: hypothetical protein N838_14030 [Thiohalocapsa sp. PB-PSB1]